MKERGNGLLRDQQRALHAYASVESVSSELKEDYRIIVNDFGTTILRSGLSAAMASLERRKGLAPTKLLDHLAKAEIPGLQGRAGKELPLSIRSMELDDYMLATREVLKVAVWLKRAVQATFGEE